MTGKPLQPADPAVLTARARLLIGCPIREGSGDLDLIEYGIQLGITVTMEYATAAVRAANDAMGPEQDGADG